MLQDSSLSSYFDSMAISTLEEIYGARLQKMPKLDILALMIALAECAYALEDQGVSEQLDIVSQQYGHQFQDHAEMMDVFRALDAEITDVREVVNLILGLASFVACRPLSV